ncbi:hypothetical protein ACFL59_03045 [Planctomycetota bacterium]
MPSNAGPPRLTVPYTIRLAEADVARIGALTAGTVFKEKTVAREALRHGLALLEQNPELLHRAASIESKAKKRRKRSTK